MTVTVLSKTPPGGRCTLYLRYADALACLLGLKHEAVYCEPGADGQAPPALVIHGVHVSPSDGVIVAPEDIVAALEGIGLQVDFARCLAEMERIQEAFLTEMAG